MHQPPRQIRVISPSNQGKQSPAQPLVTIQRDTSHSYSIQLSDLLRQSAWFNAITTVNQAYNRTLTTMQRQTGIDLRNSYIPVPGFRGRLYEAILYMKERMHWNGSQIADYLAQNYRL